MTSLLINITDDSKAKDVMRVLGDIDSVEVLPQPTSSIPPMNKSAEAKPHQLDFSKYRVDCFLECDPVEYQRNIRDEWK